MAGRSCGWACGRKRRSISDSPAAAAPAACDSSTSPTPPAKRIRYFPGLTGPQERSWTAARLATASATTTPRTSDPTSSSARASDNAELVLERAAPLAGERARRGQAVAGGARDGPRRVALAAHAEPGVRGRVLDE